MTKTELEQEIIRLKAQVEILKECVKTQNESVRFVPYKAPNIYPNRYGYPLYKDNNLPHPDLIPSCNTQIRCSGYNELAFK